MNEVFEDLRAALFSVWQRRWLVLGVAWGVALLGWLAVAMIPNSYESEARIYVEIDDVLGDQLGIKGGAERDITRVRQTLASSVNLEKVIRSTKLGENIKTKREMEGAIASLSKRVTVKSEQDNLFELKAEIGQGDLSDSENAELAQAVVQKLIDIFREENIAGNRGDVAEGLAFLDKQLEDRRRELEEAELRRQEFEAKHPDLIGGVEALSSKRDLLRTDLRNVGSDLAAAQSALAAINGQIAGTPRTVAGASIGGGGGARSALAQAQGELASMQARGLTANHPDIIALNKQIALLRRQAASESSGGATASSSPNPAYSALLSIKAERQANVQALVSRQAALQSELAVMTAGQANEPAAVAEAARINRDYEVLKKKYDELLQDREEMKIRINVGASQSPFKFKVSDPPTTPRAPSAPNRPLLLIGVLIAGLAAGVGTAFAVGQLRSTFATTAKLERALDLPVLGAVSHTMTDAARAVQAKRMRLFAGASAALGGVCVLLLVVEFIQRGMVA